MQIFNFASILWVLEAFAIAGVLVTIFVGWLGYRQTSCNFRKHSETSIQLNFINLLRVLYRNHENEYTFNVFLSFYAAPRSSKIACWPVLTWHTPYFLEHRALFSIMFDLFIKQSFGFFLNISLAWWVSYTDFGENLVHCWECCYSVPGFTQAQGRRLVTKTSKTVRKMTPLLSKAFKTHIKWYFEFWKCWKVHGNHIEPTRMINTT